MDNSYLGIFYYQDMNLFNDQSDMGRNNSSYEYHVIYTQNKSHFEKIKIMLKELQNMSRENMSRSKKDEFMENFSDAEKSEIKIAKVVSQVKNFGEFKVKNLDEFKDCTLSDIQDLKDVRLSNITYTDLFDGYYKFSLDETIDETKKITKIEKIKKKSVLNSVKNVLSSIISGTPKGAKGGKKSKKCKRRKTKCSKTSKQKLKFRY